MSSLSHHFARVEVDEVDELASPRRYSPLGAYCRSKLANLLFTFELQARLAAVDAPTIAVAAHPGGANTNLGRESPGGPFFTLVSWVRPYVEGFTQSPKIGALATLRAATDSAATGGSFFGPDGLLQIWGHPIRVRASRRARDRELAARLWDASVAATGRQPLSAHQ